MNLWQYLSDQISANNKVVLMCVLFSNGSSPGRQGFKMAVGVDGSMSGSIGGGIMEHKMVELCRSLLKDDSIFPPFIKHQVHQEGVKDKSGMICSGEQTIAFYCLMEKDLEWINKTKNSLEPNLNGLLKLDNKGVAFGTAADFDDKFKVTIKGDKSWQYEERFGITHRIYILGGGHVSLALSSLMRDLGFYVIVIDDRDALNTMVSNEFAHETIVADYDDIANQIHEGDSNYVVIVSFGYRTDKMILKALLLRRYRYLGMMGSREKVKTLMNELKEEGFGQQELNKVFTPIGLSINSKTPMEIAVSIAAQIIGIKNKS